MKKILAVFLAVMGLMFMNVSFSGTAEAAKVAVIPLQVDEENVERAGDFNSYYWDVMIEKFEYPEFELMDDEDVAKVVPEEGLASYSQDTLKNIGAQLGADIVVAMRLDKVEERPINSRREAYMGTFMKGEFASYNRITGKYIDKKIYETDEVEEVLLRKNDWQRDTFAQIVRRYAGRTIKVK